MRHFVRRRGRKSHSPCQLSSGGGSDMLRFRPVSHFHKRYFCEGYIVVHSWLKTESSHGDTVKIRAGRKPLKLVLPSFTAFLTRHGSPA